MTREELSEYRELKREIELLESKIEELKGREAYYSQDVVRGSSAQFPYTQHAIRIQGFDSEYEEKILKSIERKKIRLKKLKLKCEEEAEKIFNYVNSQEKSRTRQILIYIYIDGKTQNDVAEIMHIDRSLVSKIISECLK